MTVTTPKGFRSAGIAVGLKSTGKPDLALVVNDGPEPASAVVFTSNRAQANPILWSRKVVQNGPAQAIILNSGGANCFTGDFGYETTRLTAEAVASALGGDAEHVLVCSTGLIGSGDQAFRDKIVNGVPALAAALSAEDKTEPGVTGQHAVASERVEQAARGSLQAQHARDEGEDRDDHDPPDRGRATGGERHRKQRIDADERREVFVVGKVAGGFFG